MSGSFAVRRVEFQFQYGAIEGFPEPVAPPIKTWFQFQYGAIEGYHVEVEAWTYWEFQFQYGAIEGDASNDFLIISIHFNSSMVRLKVWEAGV